MPTIVVDVMPKVGLLDPAGVAIAVALQRVGAPNVTDVRLGKRFELAVEGPVSNDMMEQVRHIAHTLLSNSVVDDVVDIRVAHTADIPREGLTVGQ
jgi:phosphoribosylformylglycinamidine synthase subunit PurS